MSYLDKVNSPKDIKKLNIDELDELCQEIQIGRASCRERV